MSIINRPNPDSNNGNVHYSQLCYYDQCPNFFFYPTWKKYGKDNPNIFKVSYYFGGGYKQMHEQYFIESVFFTKLVKKEQ